MLDASPLFEPLQIGNKTLPNRLVMPPMVVNRDLTGSDGCEWYGERAAAGMGLVIVEATDTTEFATRLTAENLRPLVDAIHTGGALAAIQIFPIQRGQTTAPADLSLEDIEDLLEQYRNTAAICAGAGFDGIEPHGAHGYLLNQFFSPEQNERTDGYGGDLAGRMRLGLEIVEAVKPIADDADMLVLYRHTPVGQGYGIEESRTMVKKLVDAGVDVLDISPASHEAPGDRSAPFMGLGAPVIAVNHMDHVERGVEALNEKRADLVAVGRGLIVDYQWPVKVREGRFDEIIHCQNCNQCFEDLRHGVPVGCSQWD